MTEKDSATTAVKEGKKAAAKQDVAAVEGQLLHHVIRTVSNDNSGGGGSWRLADVEEYLSEFTLNGWVLQNSHYLEKLPEGYVMMWVLSKQQ